MVGVTDPAGGGKTRRARGAVAITGFAVGHVVSAAAVGALLGWAGSRIPLEASEKAWLLAALQLGDADPQVRWTVDAYRFKYALGSFLRDDAGLQAWNDRYAHLPLAEAWPLSAADFVARLGSASLQEAKAMLAPFYTDMFVPHIDTMRRLGVTQRMADAGLAATARRLFDAPGLTEERGKLLTMVLAVDPSEQTAKDFVLPLLAGADEYGSASWAPPRARWGGGTGHGRHPRSPTR